jgi:hypothetical protein
MCWQFFAFRWITLLFTHEFAFPDESVRLWDFILCAQEEHKQRLVLQMCCAMLIHIREQLLEGEFAPTLKTLQRYPATGDIATILALAKQLAVACP